MDSRSPSEAATADRVAAPATPLADRLRAQKEAAVARTAPEVLAVREKGNAEVAALHLERSSVQVGQRLPPFALPDAAGHIVRSDELLAAGPLVVTFYRGGWCPYCNLALKALLEVEPELRARGATLVAITPERPDAAAETSGKNALSFSVLSDTGSAYGRLLGLVFTVPPALDALYRQSGNDLRMHNASPTSDLPYPATYVVDREGQVVWRFVNADHYQRAEPADVLAAVAALAK